MSLNKNRKVYVGLHGFSRVKHAERSLDGGIHTIVERTEDCNVQSKIFTIGQHILYKKTQPK